MEREREKLEQRRDRKYYPENYYLESIRYLPKVTWLVNSGPRIQT